MYSHAYIVGTCIQVKHVSVYVLTYKASSKYEALSVVKIAETFLCKQRNDAGFDIFYSATVADACEHTNEAVLPRYKRPPKLVDSGSAPHRFDTPRDYYRAHYFEVLDLVVIARRFDQKSLALPRAVEKVLIAAANRMDGATIKVPTNVAEAYARDISVKRLENQLQMLPEMAASYKQMKVCVIGVGTR